MQFRPHQKLVLDLLQLIFSTAMISKSVFSRPKTSSSTVNHSQFQKYTKFENLCFSSIHILEMYVAQNIWASNSINYVSRRGGGLAKCLCYYIKLM